MGCPGFGQDRVNFSRVREWRLEPSGLVCSTTLRGGSQGLLLGKREVWLQDEKKHGGSGMFIKRPNMYKM